MYGIWPSVCCTWILFGELETERILHEHTHERCDLSKDVDVDLVVRDVLDRHPRLFKGGVALRLHLVVDGDGDDNSLPSRHTPEHAELSEARRLVWDANKALPMRSSPSPTRSTSTTTSTRLRKPELGADP